MLIDFTAAVVVTDPLAQAERAQLMFEKGPISAAAAFFCVGFFVMLWLLLRAKDRQATHIARLQKEHAQEIAALHVQDRERAVKLEITLHGLLEMMDDFRVLAFEAKRRAGRRGNKTDPGETSPKE